MMFSFITNEEFSNKRDFSQLVLNCELAVTRKNCEFVEQYLILYFWYHLRNTVQYNLRKNTLAKDLN